MCHVRSNRNRSKKSRRLLRSRSHHHLRKLRRPKNPSRRPKAKLSNPNRYRRRFYQKRSRPNRSKQSRQKVPNLNLPPKLQLRESKAAAAKRAPEISSATATRRLSRDQVPPVAAEALLALVWGEDRVLPVFRRRHGDPLVKRSRYKLFALSIPRSRCAWVWKVT